MIRTPRLPRLPRLYPDAVAPARPTSHLDRAAASISALIASTEALASATQALRTTNAVSRVRRAQSPGEPVLWPNCGRQPE